MTRETGPLLAGVKDVRNMFTFNVIVGIAGRICTGKDTLANHLLVRDGRYKIQHISNDIIRAASRDLGIPVAKLRAKKGDCRSVLQEYSRAVREEKGGTYFVQRMIDRSHGYRQTHIIVADIRTVDDLNTLWGAGARTFMIRLQAQDEVRRQRYFALYGEWPDPEIWEHETEVALEPKTLADQHISLEWDMVLDTSANTPHDLAQWVANAMHVRDYDFEPSWYGLVEKERKE